MDRLVEFVTNHWMLSGAFVALLSLLIVTESRRGGRGVSPSLVGSLVNRENGVILDIRTDAEFRAAHIGNSINIPLAQLASRLGELEKHRGKPVIVVCNMGSSAGEAVRQLAKAGHEQVFRLSGGITAWRGENLPVVRA